MALNQTKTTAAAVARPLSCSPAKKMKLSPVASSGQHKKPRVVTMTAEQFLMLAGKLQQESKSNGKPVVITLPKNFSLPTQNGTVTTNSSIVSLPASVAGVSAKLVNTNKPTELSNKSATTKPSHISQAVKLDQISPMKPAAVEADDGMMLQEVSRSSNSGQVMSTLLEKSSPLPKIIPGSVRSVMPATSLSSGGKTNDSVKPTESSATSSSSSNSNNNSATANREHFLKSGLLRGSARTTPMPLLCRKSKCTDKATSTSTADSIRNSKTARSPTSNGAAPVAVPAEGTLLNNIFSLEGDGMFDEDCETVDHDNAVWLSIMEDENNDQFVTGNDDADLLDPTRLAAQLASIRQAASQFSFTS